MDKTAAAKLGRLEWLTRIYNGDAEAATPAAAEAELYDSEHLFGLDTFAETFPPLVKLRKRLGDVQLTLGEITHEAPDLSYADLEAGDEVVFKLYVRFEAEPPNRLMYWMSYPPLPPGVSVRPYVSSDAPGCVALEEACPMELKDGSRWIIDRGAAFDDYLQLMGRVDASVVEKEGQIIGFYSCALRPIRFKGEDGHCVYQHHYRVHPDHRAGSVSMALASAVDPRRSFEDTNLLFPYSLIDPNNVHMQNVGFPQVDDVEIVRLSLPVSLGEGVDGAGCAAAPGERVCELVNATHGDRELFRPYDLAGLAERCSRIGSFGAADYLTHGDAVIGTWAVNELNKLDHGDSHEEYRLAFALDYGFASLEDFELLLRQLCARLATQGTTHLAFLCDTRAPEYAMLAELADDAQRFALHTLPWLVPDFQAKTVYCDAVYV